MSSNNNNEPEFENKEDFSYRIGCGSEDNTELYIYGSTDYFTNPELGTTVHKDSLWISRDDAVYFDEDKVDELIVALMYWKSLRNSVE